METYHVVYRDGVGNEPDGEASQVVENTYSKGMWWEARGYGRVDHVHSHLRC